MTVTVRIPEVLRRYSPASVPAEGGTVAEALEAVFRVHPELRARVLDARGRLHTHLLLFRNDIELDRASALGARVAAGDRLDLVAAAEGG